MGPLLVHSLDWLAISALQSEACPPPPLIEFGVVIVSLLLNARQGVELEDETVPVPDYERAGSSGGGLRGCVAQARPICLQGNSLQPKAALTLPLVWPLNPESSSSEEHLKTLKRSFCLIIKYLKPVWAKEV